MQAQELVKRVCALLDDPEGTFCSPMEPFDYVMGFANHEYQKLYNKLSTIGSSFDDLRVELASVPAGSNTLDDYMADGQPLLMLVEPKILEWKLVGSPDTSYRVVTGPLDAVRDVVEGNQFIDSWSWQRRSIKLANFSTDLDLRLTGDFLFDPLRAPESQTQIDSRADTVLTCQVAAAIGKAKGNPGWISQYTADAIDAFDDLQLAMVRAEQAKTRRVARISHRVPSTSFTVKNSI